jgi:hypothetical protein
VSPIPLGELDPLPRHPRLGGLSRGPRSLLAAIHRDAVCSTDPVDRDSNLVRICLCAAGPFRASGFGVRVGPRPAPDLIVSDYAGPSAEPQIDQVCLRPHCAERSAATNANQPTRQVSRLTIACVLSMFLCERGTGSTPALVTKSWNYCREPTPSLLSLAHAGTGVRRSDTSDPASHIRKTR